MFSRKPRALVILATFLLWPAAASAQADGPSYTVQEGDTLFGIAVAFGSTVPQLAAANGLADPSAIFPGQELVIPGFEGIQGSLGFEDLAFGQTLESESIRQGVSLGDLARLNRAVNPAALLVGQTLVTVTLESPGLALPTAARSVMQGGDTLLERAASQGTDLWTVLALNRREFRRWTVEGEALYTPDPARPTSGLPADLEVTEAGPLPAIQGQPVMVGVRAPAGSRPVGSLGPWTLNFVESSPGEWIALQGVHALQEPGVLVLAIGTSPDDLFAQPVEVDEGDYGRELLVVPAETLDPANTGPEDELIAEVVAQVTPERFWDGAFSFPTTFYEAFPSFFGTRRSYNGSGFIYYHTGLDLFGSSTTRVLAPADGRVAFAGFLTVRGNTTYLDHGWGVFSGFLHQSELLVQVGDMVETGQTIGFVGGTGRATGPHLHWEIWVGGVPVDPLIWTRTAFP